MSLDGVQGSRTLAVLASLPPSGVARFLADDANANRIMAAPPAAADVTQWWRTLDTGSRATTIAAAPALVGNLEGIPVGDRDLANRTVLRSMVAQLKAARSNGQTGARIEMLESIEVALTRAAPGDAARWLLSFGAEGQGRAAIVIGDLERADYVSVLVPGMFFTIEHQLDYWTDAAARLRGEQLDWLQRLEGEHGHAVATIAWIGYETPDLTNGGGIDHAYVARDSLAGLLSGVRALRGADQPYLSVVAHSYGSTAALLTLTEHNVEVDALALVGSPGSSAKSVHELRVRDGNVYVGEAAWDPVPNSSFFGSDPGSKSYGATRMSVAGATDVITGERLKASVGHNEYFSAGTESMRNFAVIAIGRGDLVTTGEQPLRAHAR
jgi:pimeloyl-ACP methyl ester carboxylesterase